jgi:threonine aldolase
VKIIDLRSDTVTLPPDAMRAAMSAAVVGDDVYEEDETVKQLQDRVATLLGKEAALFVPSGTMGNLLALLCHCQRAEQAIVGEGSHIYMFEQNGANWLGGVSFKTVRNQCDGSLDLKSVAEAINVDNVHFAKTKLVCVENSWNGHVLGLSYMRDLYALAQKHNLLVHLDGARIFNAAIALKTSVNDCAQYADSVQLCFSKGLSAPVGSILAGESQFIAQARRCRKALGGGMRQVGVLAAACLYSLDNMVDRLSEDHETAARLAEQLAQFPEIEVEVASPRTNMVFFKCLEEGIKEASLIADLKKQGFLVSSLPNVGIRAVTHYGITPDDIDAVVAMFAKVFAKAPLAR